MSMPSSGEGYLRTVATVERSRVGYALGEVRHVPLEPATTPPLHRQEPMVLSRSCSIDITLLRGEKSPLHCRSMRLEDYPTVRQLLPQVSRCSLTHTSQDISFLLSLETFHPICCLDSATQQLLAYVELIRIPHLGRLFDGRIERLVVEENYRNQGLGTLLCEAVCQLAFNTFGCGRIDLIVEKPAARAIYENKLGFKPVDTTTLRLMREEWKMRPNAK